MPLKALILVAVTAMVLVAGYYFSLWATHGFDRDFLAIHKCIESGGRWNHERRECESVPGIYLAPEPYQTAEP
jgi:hypothetical protein